MTSDNEDRSASLVTACFLLMVALAAASELSSFDLWWHLAAGRWIMGGGGIPHQDPFSHTATGAEWIDHEWLFQCIVYALHTLGGNAAQVLARALLITLTAGLCYRFVRRETGLPAAAAALMLTPYVLAGQGRFLVRPELFTLLFSVLLLTALLKRRPRSPAWKELWWIPVLFVAWANLHAGMILGIILLGAFFGGRLIEHAWHRSRGRETPPPDGRPGLGLALGLLLAAVVAGLVNPFGTRVYTVPFELTALIETGLYDNLEWTPPTLANSWLFYLVLIISFAVAARTLRRGQWTAWVPLLFLGAVSLRYVRNVAVFSFLAPILLARLYARRPEAPSPRFAAIRPALAIVVLIAAAAGFLFGRAGLGIDERMIPVAAADFIAETRPPGNLFNDMNTGGYAAWRLGPETRTFIDGRNEVFVELQRRIRRAEQDPELWRQMLDDYEIGHALISYSNPPVTLAAPSGDTQRAAVQPFAASRFPRHDWALVYWDDTAMVYVRRSTAPAAIFAAHESRYVYPEAAGYQLAAIRSGRVPLAACLRELEEKLRDDPGSPRAKQLLDAVQTHAAATPKPPGDLP